VPLPCIANDVTSAAAIPIPRTRAGAADEHACVFVSKRVDVVVAVLVAVIGTLTVWVRVVVVVIVVVVVGIDTVRTSVWVVVEARCVTV
jgi:hypothetical protein